MSNTIFSDRERTRLFVSYEALLPKNIQKFPPSKKLSQR